MPIERLYPDSNGEYPHNKSGPYNREPYVITKENLFKECGGTWADPVT